MTKPKNTSADIASAALIEGDEVWPIDRLKPSERNARKHPKKQINQLRALFRRFGQVWSILVRADGEVVAGHGRLEAMKAEKFTEVKVKLVPASWTEEDIRAFALADNRVALNAEWDEAMLGEELKHLHSLGVPLDDLGFETKEIAGLTGLGTIEGLTDPDSVPEEPKVPVAVRGDLWLLGNHALLCGNSTNAEDVKRVLLDQKPTLMVTDPPYGVEYDPSWREKAGISSKNSAKGKVENDDRADWREAWALFPGKIAYVWHGGLHGPAVEASLIACKFKVRAQIVWVKQRPVISRGAYHWQHEPGFYAVKEGEKDDWRFVPEHECASYAVRDGETGDWEGGRRQSTVWFIEHSRSATGHGTQKPIDCMKRPILNNSEAGAHIYEPFSGSGTTLLAAEMTGRICHAIELNPAYVDVAIRRWEEFTGRKAVLDRDGRAFEEIAVERLAKAA